MRFPFIETGYGGSVSEAKKTKQTDNSGSLLQLEANFKMTYKLMTSQGT